MANASSYGESIDTTIPIDITATIVKNRFVEFDGSGYADVNDDAVGVSLSAGVSGYQITCVRSKIALVEAGAAIATRFKRVETDSSGRVVGLASGRSRGVALDVASGAGDIIRVLLSAA